MRKIDGGGSTRYRDHSARSASLSLTGSGEICEMGRRNLKSVLPTVCAAAIMAGSLLPIPALCDVVVAVGCPKSDDWALDRGASEAEAAENALRTCNASAQLDQCCTRIDVIYVGCLAIAFGRGLKVVSRGSTKVDAISRAVSDCVQSTGGECTALDAECSE
jgi:Domain of unknown function (DUF4189)